MNFPTNSGPVLQLIVIFGYVIVVKLISTDGANKRAKLWHETARLAIEKGQPLPPPLKDRSGRMGLWGSGLQRGLMLIAIGAGLYLALPATTRIWGVLPVFMGIAMLINSLINRGRDGDAPSGPPSGDRLP
jgi:hypothetical protein